jgi:hypothetical protein
MLHTAKKEVVTRAALTRALSPRYTAYGKRIRTPRTARARTLIHARYNEVPHIPALAYRRLKELKDKGGLREVSDAELHIKGKARSRRIHTMPQDSPQHGSIRERRGHGDGAHSLSHRLSPVLAALIS